MPDYVEFPVDNVVNVHWKEKPHGPPHFPPCDPNDPCDGGNHELPRHDLMFGWTYFYYQPFGLVSGQPKESFVHLPLYIPTRDLPGDTQQTYFHSACAKKVTVTAYVNQDDQSGFYLAAWWRPGGQPFDTFENGELAFWIADKIGPNAFLISGPRYTPDVLAQGATELRFEIPNVIESISPITGNTEQKLGMGTLQFGYGYYDGSYPWAGEPFPPDGISRNTRNLPEPMISHRPIIIPRLGAGSEEGYHYGVRIDCGG
jgi:hypothetical protein